MSKGENCIHFAPPGGNPPAHARFSHCGAGRAVPCRTGYFAHVPDGGGDVLALLVEDHPHVVDAELLRDGHDREDVALVAQTVQHQHHAVRAPRDLALEVGEKRPFLAPAACRRRRRLHFRICGAPPLNHNAQHKTFCFVVRRKWIGRAHSRWRF